MLTRRCWRSPFWSTFDMLSDSGRPHQAQALASNPDRGLGLLQDCIHSCLSQQTSTTFVRFAAMLLQPECRAHKAFREDILGNARALWTSTTRRMGKMPSSSTPAWIGGWQSILTSGISVLLASSNWRSSPRMKPPHRNLCMRLFCA